MPLPSSFYQRGLQRLDEGDAEQAVHWFERLLELEPTYTPGWCRLGRALAELERHDEAERAWQRGPYDPDCLEAWGRALLEEDPERAARLFRTLSTRTSADPEVDLLLARAMAPSNPGQAETLILSYLERRDIVVPDLLPAIEAAMEGLEDEEALMLADAVVTRIPELEPELASRIELREVQAQAKALMGASPQPLTREQAARLREVRAMYADGKLDQALVQLEALANEAARNPEVWGALADLRAAGGDVEGAERALWLARRLDPLDAELQLRHAELLEAHFAHRFADEAFQALERAAQLQPTPEVLWKLVPVALHTGHQGAARRALESLVQSGPRRDEARRLLEALERERVEPPIMPALPVPEGVDEQAWSKTHEARVWWERARGTTPPDPERLERARLALDEALELQPDLVMARNLRAAVRWLGGDAAGAEADWKASLEQDAEQSEVLLRLSELAREQGNEAEADRLLTRAAEGGDPSAVYVMARRDAARGDWLGALERLDTYFALASSGPVHDQARALQTSLQRRLVWLGLAIVSTVAMALVVPMVWWIRRRSGSSVERWLARQPRAVRDVARIVSAIRHEVLKHNIAALPMVADAMEQGDTELLQWAGGRIDHALQQLDGYLEELRDTARASGVRLNLELKDPVFGPFLVAITRLRSLRTRLDRPRCADELRQVSHQLNSESYRELGALVRGVCVIQLDEGLFREAWARVASEGGSAQPVTLDLDVRPVAVRMFRKDLLDVLANLFRNGIEASVSEGRDRMAVVVDEDEDMITGLMRAEIRVCDEVERRLTTAMIRGRYIDRGLGLAVDLVSRAGGSVHVEKQPEWAKAVVVRLPMEEA